MSRTNGSRGIVLDVAGDERIVITSLDRPGSLGELTEPATESDGFPAPSIRHTADAVNVS